MYLIVLERKLINKKNKSKNVRQQKDELSLRDQLSNGVYIFQIRSENEVINKKIIKQ